MASSKAWADEVGDMDVDAGAVRTSGDAGAVRTSGPGMDVDAGAVRTSGPGTDDVDSDDDIFGGASSAARSGLGDGYEVRGTSATRATVRSTIRARLCTSPRRTSSRSA